MTRCRASSTESRVGNSVALSSGIGVRGELFGRVEIMELLPPIREINLDGADCVLPLEHALPARGGGRSGSGELTAIERKQRLAALAIVRDDSVVVVERIDQPRRE